MQTVDFGKTFFIYNQLNSFNYVLRFKTVQIFDRIYIYG